MWILYQSDFLQSFAGSESTTETKGSGKDTRLRTRIGDFPITELPKQCTSLPGAVKFGEIPQLTHTETSSRHQESVGIPEGHFYTSVIS